MAKPKNIIRGKDRKAMTDSFRRKFANIGRPAKKRGTAASPAGASGGNSPGL